MKSFLVELRWRDALDVLLVAVIVYRILVLFRGTRTVQMLIGLGALVVATLVVRSLELYTLQWLLDNFWSFWVIALVVVFQPELRRLLAWIGQGRLFQGILGTSREERAQDSDLAVCRRGQQRTRALRAAVRRIDAAHEQRLGERRKSLLDHRGEQ